jgi:plasmid stabilization system protein ParE
MKYTVVWDPPAESDLATIWTTAADRNAVAAAADQIDRLLARNPSGVGKSRSDQSWLLIVEPLAVLYDISDQDCLVLVWAVWRP